MRVAIAAGDGHVRVEERDEPVPGPGEVVVRVALCAISGAGVLALREGRTPAGAPLGADLAGTVVRAGEQVSGFAPGDRVATVVTDASAPVSGGLAEYALVHESAVVAVPAALSDHAVALTTTAALAWNAVQDSRVRPGDELAIVGAGALGLTVLELLRGLRPSALHVIEPGRAVIFMYTLLYYRVLYPVRR